MLKSICFVFCILSCILSKPAFAECKEYDICLITFYELLPDANAFDQRDIRITGYFRKFEGELFLFATKDAADFLLMEYAIAISTDNLDLRGEIKDGQFVYVMGFFTRSYSGKAIEVKGSLGVEVHIAGLTKQD